MNISPKRKRRYIQFLIIGGVMFFLLCACAITTVRVGQWVIDSLFGNEPGVDRDDQTVIFTWPSNSAELTVAVSADMSEMLVERARVFNASNHRTPDGQQMRVELVTMPPQKMVERALQQPNFQALAPDSSLWLGRIDQRWAALYPPEEGGFAASRVGQSIRYAVSPIVIAAWADTARQLGWPQQAIGWQQIQAKATEDANFKWNHPSTANAVGMLATLSEFYAGAGITRGLTEEIATRPTVLEYVRDVEATVRFYGEGGEIMQRLQDEGRDFLDVFVTQEQTVIAWNQAGNRREQLVALYPKEGTLWADHPLALLELDGRTGPALTNNQRRTYQAFTKFLLDDESQLALLQAGYRPADLTIDLKAGNSPFVNNNAVDAQQPQRVLQIPSASVVDVVLNVWRYTKRPTNVYLVVDTSGSMEGRKLRRTKTALHSFVAQIQGDQDKIGLVEFGSGVKHLEPLQSMDRDGRSQLLQVIESMEARGYTALVDAVRSAYMDLQSMADTAAINAIVVMTDGRENDSHFELRDLQAAMDEARVPVVIFTIAFGQDADERLLQDIARLGGGQFRRADETDIEELYRIISTYF